MSFNSLNDHCINRQVNFEIRDPVYFLDSQGIPWIPEKFLNNGDIKFLYTFFEP